MPENISCTQRREGLYWQLFLIATAALSSPVVVAINSLEGAAISTLALVALVVFALGVGCRALMVKVGLDPLGSSYAVMIFTLAFTNMGPNLDRPLGRVTLLAFAFLVSFISYRLRGMALFRIVITWGAFVLVAYPAVNWVSGLGDSSSQPNLSDLQPIHAEFVGEPRDMVIVVLDGYANGVVLRDLYHYDNSSFEDDLESNGFTVDGDTVANYGRTRFSIPSVVQLGYPIEEGPLTGGSVAELLKVVGGRSVLAEWFQDNGYRHIYIESGWLGTRCEDVVDECVKSQWPDESLHDFTFRTLLWDLPGFETGRSFTRGALNAMEWLDADLPALLGDDQPDFIWVHLLLPHPPLFLDSDCEMHAQDGIKGFVIGRPEMSDRELEEAKAWYTGQVECVNGALSRVARLVAETDSMALMFGDHGPDSLSQLFVHGVDWSEEQRFERLSAFFAARVPGCDMKGIGSLVNGGRRLVSCLSDADYPDLATQTFEVGFEDGVEFVAEVPSPDFAASG